MFRKNGMTDSLLKTVDLLNDIASSNSNLKKSLKPRNHLATNPSEASPLKIEKISENYA